MADVSFKEEQAREWIMEVEAELSQVKLLLENVSKACYELPGENDDIMKGIVATGNAMNKVWGGMCEKFERASGFIKSSMEKMGIAVTGIVGEVEKVKNKIK